MTALVGSGCTYFKSRTSRTKPAAVGATRGPARCWRVRTNRRAACTEISTLSRFRAKLRRIRHKLCLSQFGLGGD